MREHTCINMGFPGGTNGKESTCQCRKHETWSSISGLRRCPRGGHDNPLHYFCLENPMDRIAWMSTIHWVAKNQT